MRTISSILGVAVCLIASTAEADVSKAWAAAKDNLPASTNFIVSIDVAAIYKTPLFQKAFEAITGMERDIAEAHGLLKTACGWDPISVVDGIVLAGDLKAEQGVAFLQLNIDRTKTSACLEAAMNKVSKGKKVTVKQDGKYTVASNGPGKRDTAYFPWVAPNVVMISIKPDRKEVVDAWFNQKGFGASKLAGVLGKLDAKAVAAGAFAVDKPLNGFLPLTAAYGNLTTGGGKLTGVLVATATDASAATMLSGELNKELQKDMKRDKTPPSVKKIMGATKISAAGSELTIKGAVTEKELGDAFGEAFAKKKKKEVESAVDEAQVLAKMEQFATKMCACKDKACADKVNNEMTKWGEEMAKKAKPSSKPSPDLAKKAADFMTRYAECMTKVMTPKNP